MRTLHFLWRSTGAGAMALVVACGVSCRRDDGTSVPEHVQYLGKITEPEIRESSGLVVSHRDPNILWTHNDSRNPEVLYAIKRNGTLIGKWPVVGAHMGDWEDITFDNDGNLLLADTGDNRLWRRYIAVHRVKEPDPARPPRAAPIERSWLLSYPKGVRNCEAIFVLGPYCYLITKQLPVAEVYRFPLDAPTNSITLELVTELNVGSLVKSAAISPDRSTLALVSRVGAIAYQVDGDVSHLQHATPIVARFKNRHIEGCTFVPEGLMTTSESRHLYLFTNEVFRRPHS